MNDKNETPKECRCGKQYFGDTKICPACREVMRMSGRAGGNATKIKHTHEFYVSIGKKGGEKLRELIRAGRAQLEKT